MEKLKVEYVAIDKIKAYKGNAREHSEENIEQIKKSMEQFGNIDPIGIWKNEIVEGHGRLLAAKELGFKEVPAIRLDHLTNEQRKAYSLAHNKIAESSEWNFKKVDAELAGIKKINMEDFGFMPFDFEEGTEMDAYDEFDLEEKESRGTKVKCPACDFEFEV